MRDSRCGFCPNASGFAPLTIVVELNLHPMPEAKKGGLAEEKPRRRRFSILRVSLALVALYVGGYFLLMDRGTPAVSANQKTTGWTCSWSSFRWALQLNGRPVYGNWNSVFAPLDRLYFELFPSRFKLDLPTHYHSKVQKAQIVDVTKPAKLTLTTAPGPGLSVWAVQLNIRGNIDGKAELLFESHTNRIEGEFKMGRGGAYHATNFVIEYRPIRVRTGHIVIEYEFHCVH